VESIYEIFHQIKYYLNPTTIAGLGYGVLIAVVFAETGLAMGFFLPGDSLLVVAGIFAARGDLNVLVLLSTLFVAAVVGDAVGYWSGAKLGPRLFSRPKSLLFRPSHLEKAHAFYEKYGGKTIIIARFVPIVRTFAPIVAGAAKMPYRLFAVYNMVGGLLWVCSMILAGYFLGNMLERVGIRLDQHIEKVVIVVVLLSLLPMLIEYLKSRREKAAIEAAQEKTGFDREAERL
jgi:membrane-associated protein